jgi:hypothetical protein
MRNIVLRTLCGCERVFAQNGVLSPTPADIYVPLPATWASTSGEPLATKIPTRRFTYYRLEGGNMIYTEVAEKG